jgi:poly-beta-1,6-N-acetyl-D-glucosamine N-deacetylase
MLLHHRSSAFSYCYQYVQAFLLIGIFITPPAWGAATGTASCIQKPKATAPGFTDDVMTVASWFAHPSIGLEALVSTVGPSISAYFNPSPWPKIHQRARESRVPIIMYHDIVTQKEVFFDVTVEEFEQHLQLIQNNKLTPISMDQLLMHLRKGLPLSEKNILLTFDDGYRGHYDFVYPLLKKYGYPALFSIYPDKLNRPRGRPGVNWQQLREMSSDPLVTIAAHSKSHPKNLTKLADQQLVVEINESKQILESKLGIPIQYFTYPEGHYDKRVVEMVERAGYQSALTMNDLDEGFASQSETLLALKRFGQSSLETVIPQAFGGSPLPRWVMNFDFSAPMQKTNVVIQETSFTFIAGGQPMTVHAKQRGQVQDILKDSDAIAGVDGGFFSLESLDSNKMIGPVLSRNHNRFIPGNPGENVKLSGRPLVLISPSTVVFTPFDPQKHNRLAGIQGELPDVKDAFVAAAWLVKGGNPQPLERFGNLYDVTEARHRAFWGINQLGQPQIGVSETPIGSVELGLALAKAGYWEAVMLDSGASTSLSLLGESLVGYIPRPVPHVVGLVPPKGQAFCLLAKSK